MASAPQVVGKSSRDQSKLVSKAWTVQERIESRVGRLGRGKYGRVLRMARKPSPDQFRKTSMVAGAGIVILGFIGFVIYFAMQYIPQTGG